MEHVDPARSREQLENVDRDQGRLLDLYAHELRNPIAAISMAVEALQRLHIAGDDGQALTEIIARQSRYASQLIDDLLEYSRIISGKAELRTEPFDLSEVVSQAFSDRLRQFEEQGIPIQSPVLKPVWVQADRAKVHRAIVQALKFLTRLGKPGQHVVAAVEATGDLGLACIELRATSAGGESEFSTPACREPSADDCTATMIDQGSIELALAAVLIQANQGRLGVQRQTGGQMIAVSVGLPIATSTPAVTPAAATQDSSTPRSLSILIIDDSPDVVTSLQFLLSSAGHTLAVATNAADGIKTAREVRPDVILCDITLPDKDGFAVASELRSSGVYLIAVSGFDDAEHLLRSREAGFDLHLRKPDGFVGLNERLQSLPIARKN